MQDSHFRVKSKGSDSETALDLQQRIKVVQDRIDRIDSESGGVPGSGRQHSLYNLRKVVAHEEYSSPQ